MLSTGVERADKFNSDLALQRSKRKSPGQIEPMEGERRGVVYTEPSEPFMNLECQVQHSPLKTHKIQVQVAIALHLSESLPGCLCPGLTKMADRVEPALEVSFAVTPLHNPNLADWALHLPDLPSLGQLVV